MSAQFVDDCRRILAEGQYEVIDDVLIDLQTANAVVAVHDALSEDKRPLFTNRSAASMANLAWNVIGAQHG